MFQTFCGNNFSWKNSVKRYYISSELKKSIAYTHPLSHKAMQLHLSWVLLMTPHMSRVHLKTTVARLFDPLIQPIPIPLLLRVALPKQKLRDN